MPRVSLASAGFQSFPDSPVRQILLRSVLVARQQLQSSFQNHLNIMAQSGQHMNLNPVRIFKQRIEEVFRADGVMTQPLGDFD